MELKFDDRGLIPAVVQQYDTDEVLMVAWMNAESLRLTQETKNNVVLEPQPSRALEQRSYERKHAACDFHRRRLRPPIRCS